MAERVPAGVLEGGLPTSKCFPSHYRQQTNETSMLACRQRYSQDLPSTASSMLHLQEQIPDLTAQLKSPSDDKFTLNFTLQIQFRFGP